MALGEGFMKRTLLAVAMGSVAGLALAGADNVKFPANYLKGDLYATIDRADTKQYRELYASPGVLDAVRQGKPIPSGAVLTLVQWSVEADEAGTPKKGADGRFIKKDILAHTVMEKRAGWGAEYGADKRNGEWEYQAFNALGQANPKANIDACFQCHLPHAKQDFVMTLSKLSGTFPGAHALKTMKGDVNIASFSFMPGKISATVGKALSFLNSDDSPHQISVANGPKTAVLLRGQKASMTFDKAGEYSYICGLHPTMKGVIEVR
jgi:plastocyanin